MTPDLPAWTPFDPDAPPSLSPNGERSGRVVALVAGEGAMEGGWVGEVALGLAASWGVSTGGRVVAADAAFQEPCLHRAAGVPLAEGLSDMLLWGGSLQRVARAAERVGFVVTAGTPIADGAAALGSPRWAEVCEGFRDAGVTLVVLVPATEAGLPNVVAEASDVVLLLRSDEPAAGVLTVGLDKVRATVGKTAAPAEAPFTLVEARTATAAPPAPVREAAEAVAEVVEPGASAFEAALREAIQEADAEERAAARVGAGAGAGLDNALGDALEDAEDPLYRVSGKLPGAGAPRPTRSGTTAKRARGGGRLLALVALVVVLLAVVLVAAFLGFVNIPGITRTGAGGEPAGEGAALAPAAGAPRQAYSVDVGAYDDASAAAERVVALAAAAPDVVFFTQPVAESGILRYHVLGGPATDQAAAASLLARLSTALGAALGEAHAVATPRAFQLGEMPELGAALRRVAVLGAFEIPAYVLAVDYDDGSVRYRVYAGAYAEESEGVGLARLLQERGLHASALTDRIGRPPGAES